MPTFRTELERLINQHSQENGSNTPDYILAGFIEGCLGAFDVAVTERTRWYGHEDLEKCPSKQPGLETRTGEQENLETVRHENLAPNPKTRTDEVKP